MEVSASRESDAFDSDDITVLEEWNGSSSTKLSRTAIITASPSLCIQRLLNFPTTRLYRDFQSAQILSLNRI